MAKAFSAIALVSLVFLAAPVVAADNAKQQSQNGARQGSDQALVKKPVRLRLRRILM